MHFTASSQFFLSILSLLFFRVLHAHFCLHTIQMPLYFLSCILVEKLAPFLYSIAFWGENGGYGGCL